MLGLQELLGHVVLIPKSAVESWPAPLHGVSSVDVLGTRRQRRWEYTFRKLVMSVIVSVLGTVVVAWFSVWFAGFLARGGWSGVGRELVGIGRDLILASRAWAGLGFCW